MSTVKRCGIIVHCRGPGDDRSGGVGQHRAIVVHALMSAYHHGHRIYFIGNGDSAATASHVVGDVDERVVLRHAVCREVRQRVREATGGPAPVARYWKHHNP